MGMYTGLRFKGIIKPQYRKMIQHISNNDGLWRNYHHLDFLTNYLRLSRAEFIPKGALAYMPDSWEDESIPADSFRDYFDPETGYWAFRCSLKNYEDEIDVFLKDVLPIIAESAEHIEVLYEEWSASNLYELKDNKVFHTDQIVYEYTEEGDWI